jgi:hypothetical protein
VNNAKLTLNRYSLVSFVPFLLWFIFPPEADLPLVDWKENTSFRLTQTELRKFNIFKPDVFCWPIVM